jgi:D-cysteine desulfhydrase/L-cysteate sulfo-lyase
LLLVNFGQSNSARLHAAACVRLGLRAIIVKPGPRDERVQGNLLLDHVLGAEVIEAGTSDAGEVERIVADLRADFLRGGHRVYVVREQASQLAGVIAYADLTVQLAEQVAIAGLHVDHIFLVAGTSSTGLQLAARWLGQNWQIHAISVGDRGPMLPSLILEWARGAASRLGLPCDMSLGDFLVHEEHVGRGYSVVTPGVKEAVRLAARTEALFLDPVYTGKAMAGLIAEIRAGRLRQDETAVFVHTGGLPIIFQYDHELTEL